MAQTQKRLITSATVGNSGSPASIEERSVQLCNEAHVVASIKRGNLSLFAQLARPYQRLIFRNMMAHLHCEDAAEEIAQETLAIAWAKICQLRDPRKFRSWILQIAYNQARLRARRERTVIFKSLEELRFDEPPRVREPGYWDLPSARGFEKPELRVAMIAALAGLPPMYRQAFILRYIEGTSIAETAAKLGITPASVRTRSLRARIKMRIALVGSLGLEDHRAA